MEMETLLKGKELLAEIDYYEQQVSHNKSMMLSGMLDDHQVNLRMKDNAGFKARIKELEKLIKDL